MSARKDKRNARIVKYRDFNKLGIKKIAKLEKISTTRVIQIYREEKERTTKG